MDPLQTSELRRQHGNSFFVVVIVLGITDISHKTEAKIQLLQGKEETRNQQQIIESDFGKPTELQRHNTSESTLRKALECFDEEAMVVVGKMEAVVEIGEMEQDRSGITGEIGEGEVFEVRESAEEGWESVRDWVRDG